MSTVSDYPTRPAKSALSLDALDAFRGSWATLLTLGIAMMILGCLAFAAAAVSTMISMMIIGVLLIGAAAMQMTYAFLGRGWRGFALHLGLGVIYLLGGAMFVSQPVFAAESMTMFLGYFLIVSGIFRLIGSLQMRSVSPSWGWAALSAVVSVILGGLILLSWPIASLFVIGLLVGVDLAFLGGYLTLFALSIKSEHRAVKPRTNLPVYG